MPGPPALTHRLWGSIAGLYDQIIAHPFLAGLADGSLDQDKFRFYVVQDALYLREYARALSVCGARAPAEDDVAMFNQHAAGAIAVERELHAGFLADFGLTPAEVEATPMAPTNRAYTSYLLASVYAGSFPEALAAVLPCYWIYAEVGAHLLARGSPDPLYRRWIDTYGGEEFAAVVQAVRDLTDRVGADLAGPDLARVFERFATTSRYEWMFWDAAWRQERWPV
jgi:thiaminase (transcriptional activator TenA)